MKHKALIRRLQISCLGLDPIDPLRLLVDDVIAALAQHDSVQAKPEPEQEPVCPDCKAKVLYECVACSSNNYPPKTKQELCKYGQEPKSCTSSPMDCQCAIDAALAQQEQEPVAWMHIQGRHQELSHFPLDDGEISRGWEQYPLYTTPPQRTWVGLTDEQITQVIKSMPRGIKGWMSDWDLYEFSKAIEAKFKERNT